VFFPWGLVAYAAKTTPHAGAVDDKVTTDPADVEGAKSYTKGDSPCPSITT